MKKDIMIHYLPLHSGIQFDDYVETVKNEFPYFSHLFFPSMNREGVEIIKNSNKEDKKEIL